MKPTTTRREALIAISGVAGVPAIQAQQHQHGEEVSAATGAYKPKTLTAAEMATVGKLCDVIIPRTETPGASDAGVPEFIDRRLSATVSFATAFRRGLALVNVDDLSYFTAANDAPDTELGRFFKLVKDMTIDGYYSSRAGLVEELGWHGNTFLTEFKGCTHPEHQA